MNAKNAKQWAVAKKALEAAIYQKNVDSGEKVIITGAGNIEPLLSALLSRARAEEPERLPGRIEGIRVVRAGQRHPERQLVQDVGPEPSGVRRQVIPKPAVRQVSHEVVERQHGSFGRQSGGVVSAGGADLVRQQIGRGRATASTSVAVGLNPTSITGPGNVTGTVTITPAAPSGGATVSLQITAGSGTLSASQVAIAQGANQADFTLTVNAVASATNVEVTATYGSTTGRGTVSVTPSVNTHGLIGSPAESTDGRRGRHRRRHRGARLGRASRRVGGQSRELQLRGGAPCRRRSRCHRARRRQTSTSPSRRWAADRTSLSPRHLAPASIPKTLRLEPITANFSVVPDAGTGANPPLQCAVTNSGDAASPNLLQCTFDASSSLPTTGITNYRWTLPGLANPINQNSSQLIRPKVGCGAGLNTVNVQLAVTLVVTAPGGTSSPKTQMVLFTKAGPC